MTAIIEVANLVKRFGTFTAVRGVSFQVEPGEIFGYLGANGAGKSTTIKILCGLSRPTSGVARVAGHDVATNPDGVRLAVGYMSQRFSLYPDLSSLENMDFFGGAYQMPRKRRLARAAELLGQVGLDPGDATPTAAMPGGVRQRLALATALLHDPKIVFLDEPTAGVDPEARRTFWRIIRRLAASGTSVFVTTHYMDEAEYCHRVGLMVDGELVALDTPAGLKASYVPGRTFDVRGGACDLERLSAIPGIRRVEPFGAGLHVNTDDGFDPERLRRVLGRLGNERAVVSPVEPTLEDVFLAVVSRNRKAA